MLAFSKGIFHSIILLTKTQTKYIVHVNYNFYVIPVLLKSSDKMCSFMQRTLFRSTGKMLVVLVVSRVRFVPGSRENQREEKSHPDSAADTRF